MHDYLDILGLPNDAPPSEVRRACARRIRRSHPDFAADRPTAAARAAIREFSTGDSDVAIDFAEMAVFLDRIQAAFFADVR